MEKINHAEEAVRWLAASVIDTHGDDDRKVAVAQVHATLALAEQQRIANLIAYASHRVDHLNVTGGATVESFVRLMTGLDLSIREELGL